MRRRIFTLASAVSLLLCVATVVLWVRSYSVIELFGRSTVDEARGEGWSYRLSLNRGDLLFSRDHIRVGKVEDLAFWNQSQDPGTKATATGKPVAEAPSAFFHASLPLAAGRRAPPYVIQENWMTLARPSNLLARIGFWGASSRSTGGRTTFLVVSPSPSRFTLNTINLTTRSGFEAHLPLYFVAAVFLLAGLPMIRRITQALRRPRTGCPTCSYDLTGNTSGVCPECGTAVAGKAGA